MIIFFQYAWDAGVITDEAAHGSALLLWALPKSAPQSRSMWMQNYITVKNSKSDSHFTDLKSDSNESWLWWRHSGLPAWAADVIGVSASLRLRFLDSFSACINNNFLFFFCRLASASIVLGSSSIVFTLRLRACLSGTNPAQGVPVCVVVGCISTGFNSFKKTHLWCLFSNIAVCSLRKCSKS